MDGKIDRLKVCIKYCGGCNPDSDGVEAVSRIKQKVGDGIEFRHKDEGEYDLILAVQGCKRACADLTQFEGFKILTVKCIEDIERVVGEINYALINMVQRKERIMGKEFKEEDQQIRIQKLEVGDRFTTKPRVISKADVEQFASMTGYTLPFFLSEAGAKEAGWQGQLVPGMLTVSMAIGLLIQSGYIWDVTASLGADTIKFEKPVYVGDEIRVETEITSKKQTKKGGWITSYNWAVRNQKGEIVASGNNT